MMRIDSEDSLQRVADYCHDAVFEMDRITYDRESMAFSLVLAREVWERAEKGRKVLFLRVWRVPNVEFVLTLYDVTDADVRPKDVLDFLVNIDYDASENSISFRCTIGTRIRLRVKRLRGTLQDTGRTQSHFRRFAMLGWEPVEEQPAAAVPTDG